MGTAAQDINGIFLDDSITRPRGCLKLCLSSVEFKNPECGSASAEDEDDSQQTGYTACAFAADFRSYAL